MGVINFCAQNDFLLMAVFEPTFLDKCAAEVQKEVLQVMSPVQPWASSPDKYTSST